MIRDNTTIQAKAKMMRDTILEISSVSNYGEHIVERCLRSEFEMPGNWSPVNVQGIYGEYVCQDTESEVYWNVTVLREVN